MNDSARPRKRGFLGRFRFGLRALLAIVLLAAVYFAHLNHRARKQRQAYETLTSRKVTIYFDRDRPMSWDRPIPIWARAYVPREYYQTATEIDAFNTGLSDTAPLWSLSEAHVLSLECCPISDLSPVAAFTSLRHLDLEATHVTDLGPLSGLPCLESIDASYANKLEDIAPLALIHTLKSLDLSGTAVTDVSPLESLPVLERLRLVGSMDIDLRPLIRLQSLRELSLSYSESVDHASLMEMTQLETLDLRDAKVDAQTLAKIQAALPNCKVE